jgi:hypothetical protein
VTIRVLIDVDKTKAGGCVVRISIMFDTERFRDRLSRVIGEEACMTDCTQYELSIVNVLWKKAVDNSAVLMQRERRKSPAMQRGVSDALSNARYLIARASSSVAKKGRTVLLVSDVEAALKEGNSRAWPFSKV